MATALQRITGLSQLTISSSGTAPTEAQVTEFLLDGIKDFTNKIVNLRPDEAYKFAGESSASDDSGIAVLGKVLSVVREHDSTSILRPCSPMSPELRYESTDVNSLHYRSKYNPGWYTLNKKIHVRPAAAGSDNDMKVSQIVYGSADHGSNMGGWTNFPIDYEDIVIYYAAAESCLAAASDIQNNMPTKPTAPVMPSFEKIDSEIALPELPYYNPPPLAANLSTARAFIAKEDFETSKQLLEIISKEYDEYEKLEKQEKQRYDRESKIFDSKLANLKDNKEREFSIIAGDYRSQIYKYQYDITQYQSELQEKLSKYKWFIEQYVSLLNEYNKGIAMSIAPQQKPKGQQMEADTPQNIEEGEE